MSNGTQEVLNQTASNKAKLVKNITAQVAQKIKEISKNKTKTK